MSKSFKELKKQFKGFSEIIGDFKYSDVDNRFNMLDGDIALHISHICKGIDRPHGICAIHEGLESYYEGDFFLEEEKYVTAIEATKGKIGIVQLQSLRNISLKNENVPNFRKSLVRKMLSLEIIFDFEISFFLSGELNYWNHMNSRDQMFNTREPVPSESVFKGNYDYIAKRHGFRYDSETKLFWRK